MTGRSSIFIEPYCGYLARNAVTAAECSLRTGLDDFGEATHVKISQSVPVFGIIVDHQSDVWVIADVLDSPQAAGW